MSFLKPDQQLRSSNRFSVNQAPASAESNQPQTTSTPFHDSNRPPMTVNPDHSHINILPQFYSTGIGNFDRPLLKNNINVTNIQSGQHTHHHVPKINIINNTTANMSNISDTTSDKLIQRSYRVKSITTESDELIEAKLRAKEKALEHLRSIDLTKFSFPNE
jgi:hypothetical protein